MAGTDITGMASSLAGAEHKRGRLLCSENEFYGRVAALCLFFYVSPVFAGTVDITPRIRLGAIYTDNVFLEPSDEEADVAAEITPGISIRADGNRLNGSLDYRMENYVFYENSDANNTAHQLLANGTAELSKDLLFLDASSQAGQAVIDAERTISINNFNTGGGNRTDFYTYTLSPYAQNNFGGWVSGSARYTYSQLHYDEGTSDSTVNGIDTTLASGRMFKEVSWFGNYSWRDVDYDDSGRQDDTRENANGEIRHRMTQDFTAVAQAGWANNELQSSRDSDNGTYWAVGGFWQSSRFWSLEALTGQNLTTVTGSLFPTVRTSLVVNYRDSDVGLNSGKRWTVNANHRTRRTSWNARYFEDTTTQEQRQLDSATTFFGVDPITGEINPDPQPGDVVVPVQTDIFTLTDEVEERKRASGTFGMDTGRTGIRLTVFHENRDRLESGTEEKTRGGTASVNRRLAPRTNTILTSSFRRITGDTREDTDFWYIDASLVRQIARGINGSLSYRFTRQDSNDDQQDYDENHVIARLTAAF
jgi:uncharacterized protein (PEP-CTERM system associated)